MKAVNLQALEQLIGPAVTGQGYELVDLAWRREQGGNVFRLFIDRQPGQGYVSHEDCVKVSREVSALLDVHDVLPGSYSLEVSSPGVDRPLRLGAHFRRFLGQRAKVRMREGVQVVAPPLPPGKESVPRRNFTGVITAVTDDDEVVSLRIDEDGPRGGDSIPTIELRIGEMEKANLIYSP